MEKLKKFKHFFEVLDPIDLKIMKIGLRFCFGTLIFSCVLLLIYLFNVHSIFLYNLGLTIFRLSIYISIEFVICGLIVDSIKKQS